ncbi:MAG: hypothetical protein J6M34_01075 [Clostridia bacterium]|nr:hypothetical protein [Clostridia bacterium]
MTKKIAVFVVVFVLLFSLCSCGFFGPSRYICNPDNVKSVQIVRLDRYIEAEYEFEYTVLHEIADRNGFLKKLNEIKQSKSWGPPLSIDEGYVVVRIEYYNGDYDFIYHDSQSFTRSNKNNSGYFFFDKEEFEQLIAEYIK